jgi:hypothetical protein
LVDYLEDAVVNRNEAIAFLKEVFEKCTLLDGQYLCLMPPSASSSLSKGYQIHMKNPLHSDDLVCMNDILRRYGLLLKIEEDLTIIYRPPGGKNN